MKRFLALLLLVPLVYGHGVSEEAVVGPYTIELSTVPEQLEPGSSNIIVNVLKDGEPVLQKDLWMRLSNGNKVYLASAFKTDQAGSVSLSYLFGAPGSYELTVEVDGYRTELPVHVHGQYVLLFGFLAAVFIVLALLLDKI